MVKKVLNYLEKSKVIFLFFATLPLILADFVLRYSLNYIEMVPKIYNIVPILFTVFWTVLFMHIFWAVLPEKIGRIVYVIFTIAFGVWFFANFVCYKIFSHFLWFENVFLASEASKYISSVVPYLNIFAFLVFMIYIISILITCKLWTKAEMNGKLKYGILILLILGIIGLQIFMNYSNKKAVAAGAWEVWENPALVYSKFEDANKSLSVAGFYQYTLKNIGKMIFKPKRMSDAEENFANEFFSSKIINDNDMTGILKDKNVIFVLMESIDEWMITEKYMPTIKYMMNNGINFKNHYMPNMGMGYTFNAEFAANTGYYCPSDESSASVYTRNTFPLSFANLLNGEGYRATSFHFNNKNFYNREAMHIMMGYDRYESFMKYLPLEKCVIDSEAVKNDEIYKLMTEGDKFMDFVITYSAHLPYTVYDNKLTGISENYAELRDENLDEELNNAYLLAHDTDEFFRILLERLKEDNLLNDTVIVGFTDHYAYGIQDKEKLDKLKDGNKPLENCPFFIYYPGISKVEVNKVTNTTDILPTLLNLFGIKSNYCIGRDAFDNDYNGIAYFPDGTWYDGDIFFERNKEYPKEKLEYIEEVNNYLNKLQTVNDYVIKSNYFLRNN